MNSQGGLLSGRSAVITGASRGIGRELALRMAREGAQLLLISRTDSDLQRLAELTGAGTVTLRADLGSAADVDNVVRVMAERVPQVDILVNNAGAFYIAPLEELPPEQFAESVQVNLNAPFMLLRSVLSAMRRAGRGHVVTVGSVADRVILPENAGYASTKYGLRALHEVARLETRGSGVRCTLVSPGAVDTRLWDDVDPDNREGFTPRASMLDPAAVADAIMFALTRPDSVCVEELRIARS